MVCEKLPWPHQSFDLVLAGYSLYFFLEIIPDIARVLRPGSALVAITHSEHSFAQLCEAVGLPLTDAPIIRLVERFSAENGMEALSRCFVDVQKIDYPNSLRFANDQLRPLLEYARFKLPLFREELSQTPSPETAIAACVGLHQTEWAIQDSFKELQSSLGHDMLSDSVLRMIEDHAEDIASAWSKDVRENPTTLSYRRVDRRILEEKAAAALHQFDRWLAGLEADDEIRVFYRTIGAQRRGQGIELYRVMELDRRIVMFYDKAMYHLVRGYLDAEPMSQVFSKNSSLD